MVFGTNTGHREQKSLLIPLWNTDNSRMQFYYTAAVQFNYLCYEIENVQKLNTFRSKFEKEILDTR